MLHLCMFLRHEDSREHIGKFILQNVIRQSRSQRKHRMVKDSQNSNSEKTSEKTAVRGWLYGMVKDLADHVSVTKSTSHSVTKYLNVKVVDSEFHEWVSQWLDELFPNHFDRFMAASITLLAKVSSQQLPTKLTAKSEVIKRRIRDRSAVGHWHGRTVAVSVLYPAAEGGLIGGFDANVQKQGCAD